MSDYAPLIGVLVAAILIGSVALISHLLFEGKKKVTQPTIPSTATPECPNYESRAMTWEDSWGKLMREKIRKHAKLITVKENKKLIDVDIMERAIHAAAKEYVQSLSEDQNSKSA